MKKNRLSFIINRFGLMSGICFFIIGIFSLEVSGQSMPLGIIIASTSDYEPNGEGQSIDTTFNNILVEYGVSQYERAYPFAKTENALNCFRITLSDSTQYLTLGYLLDSIELFDEVIIDSLQLVSCQNPVSYDDAGVQGSDGWNIEMANLPCAWSITTGDPNCVIAIVDQFFDNHHDDLLGKFVSFNLDCKSSLSGVGHGFASAGAAAAIVNNNFCAVGSGYDTKVAGYCVGLSQTGGNPGIGIIQAYHDGYKFINASYNGSGVAKAMLEEIVASGVTITGSPSGSSGWKNAEDIPGVILVGQVDVNADYVPYNVWEPGVDIYAPCVWVDRLEANNSCSVFYGFSSFGAPMIAGILALMKSVNQDLCPSDYSYLLNITHQGLPANSLSFPEMTAGIVDAEAAVLAAQSYQKYSIDTYTEWDEDKIVNELIIEPGGELVIKDGAVIKFGSNAEVTVKRGARLVVDGSTLTVNECSGEFWRGINIWGNYSLAQPNANSSLSPENAGIVVIKNNSLIEKAKSALMTAKMDEEWDTQYWGGVMYCQNSQFINNTRVAEFMKYEFPNKSKFDNCTLDGIAKGVTIWDTDGVTFRNCRFYNMEHQGILAYDANVIVKEGNDFHHNQRGIFSQATYPFSGFIEIGDEEGVLDRNYFYDNSNHIESNATSFGPGLKIFNNDFYDADNIAICISGPSRFVIGNNVIEDFLGGVYGYQTAGLNWNQHNYIQDNVIEGIVGIVAEGKNKEMQFPCNEFTNTLSDFILRQEGDMMSGDQGEIRKFQGSSGLGSNNCFTNPGSIPDIKTLGQTLGFKYYISGTQTCRTPLFSGNYTTGPALESGCGNDPMFETPIYSDYINVRDSVSFYEQNYPGSDTLAFWMRTKNDVLVYLVKEMIEADSMENAFDILDLEDSEASELMKFGIAVSRNHYILADSLLSNFTDDQGEMTAFKEVQEINLAWLDGGLSYVLIQADSILLEEVAVSNYGVRSYARALLGLIFDRVFEDYPDFDEDYFAEERMKLNELESFPIKDLVSIFPNPAQEVITIRKYSDIKVDGILVSNLLGTPVLNSKLPIDFSHFSVQVNSLTPGVYTVQLTSNGEIIYSTLLVIEK